LVVLCETNVLNLISQQLDTIYQIKPKRATVLFLHLFAELNTPLMVLQALKPLASTTFHSI
jgi:hypothetical protein